MSLAGKLKACFLLPVPPDFGYFYTSSDLTVAEGANTTLVCKAHGHPQPLIRWRKENGNSFVVMEGNHKREGNCLRIFSSFQHKPVPSFLTVHVWKGEQLPLFQIHRGDMGAFMCIATNGVPPSVCRRIMLSVNCKSLKTTVT